MATREEPTQRLAKDAQLMFAIRGLIGAVPVVIAAIVLAGLLDGNESLSWLRAPLIVAGLLIALLMVGLIPWLRVRHWRYELRSDELEIKHGVLTVTRTVIPISRVQHVDIERTLTSSMVDLVELGIHTAGGSHEIPALDELLAKSMRDQIADQLHKPDEL